MYLQFIQQASTWLRDNSDADIRKLLGGNLLRAWTAIEAGAAK